MENDEILEETSGEKEELFEHFRFVVDPGTEIVRLDRYLTNLMAHTSRNRIQQAAKADCILVNDRPVKSNYRVHPRDVISILLPRPVHVFELIAEDIPLDIVYEDEDVILINKPAGMWCILLWATSRARSSTRCCGTSKVSATPPARR